jgi:hypothetical protein
MIYQHPSQKGDSAEVLLMAELVSRGLTVSIPFGHNQLYDLVVENGKSGRLLKVQVKFRGSLHNKYSYKFGDMSKYVGKVDVVAFFCGGDWYFWTGLKLKRYGCEKEVILKIKYNMKNNFKIFGCSA